MQGCTRQAEAPTHRNPPERRIEGPLPWRGCTLFPTRRDGVVPQGLFPQPFARVKVSSPLTPSSQPHLHPLSLSRQKSNLTSPSNTKHCFYVIHSLRSRLPIASRCFSLLSQSPPAVITAIAMAEKNASKFPVVQGGGSLIIAWQVKGKKVLVVGGGEVVLPLRPIPGPHQH
jgi:hypothetical protein